MVRLSKTKICNYYLLINYFILAFTTWLFHSMFYFTNFPLKSETLDHVIKVQVCMVQILSHLNFELHNKIVDEYISILRGKKKYFLRLKILEVVLCVIIL